MAQADVAQANVISAPRQGALQSIGFPCSIPRLAVAMPPAWQRVSANAMDSVQTRNEADVGRSALMAAAQRGDRAAYEKLLRDCVPFITGIARRRGVPPDRVDDVVQETLLTIHRARATYDPRRSFDAWLRVIVERRSVDVLRQAYRHGAREVHAPLAYEGHAEGGVNLTAANRTRRKCRMGSECGCRAAGTPARSRAPSHAGGTIARRCRGIDRPQQRLAQGQSAPCAQGAAPQGRSWS